GQDLLQAEDLQDRDETEEPDEEGGDRPERRADALTAVPGLLEGRDLAGQLGEGPFDDRCDDPGHHQDGDRSDRLSDDGSPVGVLEDIHVGAPCCVNSDIADRTAIGGTISPGRASNWKRLTMFTCNVSISRPVNAPPAHSWGPRTSTRWTTLESG